LTLAATDKGLATCWICRFDTMRCAELLKLPDRVYPVAIIPLGYPEKENNFADIHLVRKPLEKIISWEGYNF
jgi:nitroreductase